MNKRTAVFGVLVLVGSLSACQKQDTNQHPQNTEQTSASAVSDATLTLQGETEKLQLNLPECDGNSCPEFSVDRLHTNQLVVDKTIDQAILQHLEQILEISNQSKVIQTETDQEPRKREHADQQQQASVTLQNNHAIKTPAEQMAEQVQPYLTAFLALDQELKKIGASNKINIMVSPKILNADGPLVTVVLNTSSYLGGAHGSSSQTYYNFDLKQQKQMTLDDVLLPNQKANLDKLAYQAFKTWVADAKLAENIADYEQVWKFILSKNFYLGQKSLILQYGEYEIGPYVVGLPRLEIPYAQLQNILKKQYLPEKVQVVDTATEKKTQS
nr:RsiV family protein [Acinetobacter silvestris]